MNNEELYCLAFIDGYYEGTSDDCYYRDHSGNTQGVNETKEDAEVFRNMVEYRGYWLKQQEKNHER